MAVMFSVLWSNHPSRNGNSGPCTDKNGARAFGNQCAIRMGLLLRDSGVSTYSFTGRCCWHGHGRAHILRAEEWPTGSPPNRHSESLKRRRA